MKNSTADSAAIFYAFSLSLGETKSISCFTGQASQKSGSVGRQKNKNKSWILITKAQKILVKLSKSWQKYENDKWKTQKKMNRWMK